MEIKRAGSQPSGKGNMSATSNTRKEEEPGKDFAG